MKRTKNLNLGVDIPAYWPASAIVSGKFLGMKYHYFQTQLIWRLGLTGRTFFLCKKDDVDNSLDLDCFGL